MVVEYWETYEGTKVSYWLRSVEYCCERSSQVVSYPRTLKKQYRRDTIVYIGFTREKFSIDYCPYCGAKVHRIIKGGVSDLS